MSEYVCPNIRRYKGNIQLGPISKCDIRHAAFWYRASLVRHSAGDFYSTVFLCVRLSCMYDIFVKLTLQQLN